jgi:hypothetical protein
MRQQRMFVVDNNALGFGAPHQQIYGQPPQMYGPPVIYGGEPAQMYGGVQAPQMLYPTPQYGQPQPYPMTQYPVGGGMMSGPPAGSDNSGLYARNPYASAQQAEAPLKASGYAPTMALPVARVSYPPIPPSTQAHAQPQPPGSTQAEGPPALPAPPPPPAGQAPGSV